jgi:hypothetical protein
MPYVRPSKHVAQSPSILHGLLRTAIEGVSENRSRLGRCGNRVRASAWHTVSLSPPLLVSLSPFLPVSLSPCHPISPLSFSHYSIDICPAPTK